MRSPAFLLPFIFTLVVLLCLVIVGNSAQAESFQFVWATNLSVSEQYDDNVNLEETDKQDDWITSVTPGLRGGLETEKTSATLNYDLSFVTYAKSSNDDTLRHTASLGASRPITEYATLGLLDSFSYREDPLLSYTDEVEDPSGIVSDQRYPYYINTARANVYYMLGNSGSLDVAFVHTLYENTAPDTESRQSFSPSADLTHWFNTHHGMTLSYSYVRTEYEQSHMQAQHTGNASYTYRFNLRDQASLACRYDMFEYGGTRGDYLILDGSLAFSHRFSEQASGSISVGYSMPANDDTSSSGRVRGAASFSWQTPIHGYALNVSSGYRMSLFQAPEQGFSWNRNASVYYRYQILEKLSLRLSGFFNQEEFEATAAGTDTTWGTSAGLEVLLLDWLSGSMGYQYRQMDSDLYSDFIDNRVTVSLIASYSGEPRPF